MKLWVLLLPLMAAGQDIGSLHIFNGDVALGKGGLLQVHTRVRTDKRFREYFQFRGGPIYFHTLRPSVMLIGGYYFIDEDTEDGELNRFHRTFGGVQFLTPTGKRMRLEARTLLERFKGVRDGDFWRARERLWLTYGQGKVRPYGQVEGLVQRGIPMLRLGSGLLFRGSKHDVWAGYEFRQLPNGTHLHMVTSNVTIRLRSRR